MYFLCFVVVLTLKFCEKNESGVLSIKKTTHRSFVLAKVGVLLCYCASHIGLSHERFYISCYSDRNLRGVCQRFISMTDVAKKN